MKLLIHTAWYLRTLPIHSVTEFLMHAKEMSAWGQEFSKRRPSCVETVAQANKMARTIWALLRHDRPYQTGYLRVKPA